MERLNREVVKMVNTAQFKDKKSRVGAEPVGSTPEECAEMIRNELVKWTTLVKQTGIRFN